ncbi:MAG: hypothetical protein U5K32_02600 [Bacteroidales bacterium]|nr:hypothetical protein [Bacteroidales bacterium]
MNKYLFIIPFMVLLHSCRVPAEDVIPGAYLFNDYDSLIGERKWG